MKKKSTQKKAIKPKHAGGVKKAAPRDPWHDECLWVPRSAKVFPLLQDGKKVNCTIVAELLDVSEKVAQSTIGFASKKRTLKGEACMG